MGADELARLTGLSAADVAFWLPRLPGPVLASAPATVERLRQIAGLRRGGVVHPLSSTATVIRAATGQPFPEAPGLGRARGAVARRQREAEQRARQRAAREAGAA